MKFNNASTPPNPRYSIPGGSVSPRPTTGSPNGGSNVRKPTTNYNSKSSQFQLSNGIIVYLDDLYETYSSTSKSAWDDAADSMTDAKVCGCFNEPMTGKKLHRVTNWPSVSTGGTPTDTPPDLSDWYSFNCSTVEKEFFASPPPVNRVVLRLDFTFSAAVLSFMPRRQRTVSIPIPASVIEVNIDYTDPLYPALLNIRDQPACPWCAALVSGVPLTAGYALVETEHFT